MCRGEQNTDVKVNVNEMHLTWNKLLEGRFEDGDCGNPVTQPGWFDRDKFSKGQKVLRDNILGCMFCHLAGLVLGVAIEIPYLVLTNVGNHGCMKELGIRYISTSKKIISWYTSDIFDPKSEGGKSIALVRRMHGAAHRTMKRSHPRLDREQWMSQFYMATTQISFIGFIMLFPRAVGLRHLSRKDKEAVLHYWRCIGYLLGISDSYNVCGQPLETVQELTQNFIDELLKPAMLNTNCDRFRLAKGIVQSVLTATRNRVATVNAFILYWCNVMNITYEQPLSFRDRLSAFSFRLIYGGPLLGFRMIRNVLNKLHLRKYNGAEEISKQLPSCPLNSVIEDFNSCPFSAK